MRLDFSLKQLFLNGNKMNVVVYGSQMWPTVWGHIVDVGHNGKIITRWLIFCTVILYYC